MHSSALAYRPVDQAPGAPPVLLWARWMARTGSPRRAPEPKNANPSSVPNTMWANSSNGWLAASVALPYIMCGTNDRQSTSTTELGPRPHLADVAALLATVIQAARQ